MSNCLHGLWKHGVLLRDPPLNTGGKKGEEEPQHTKRVLQEKANLVQQL